MNTYPTNISEAAWTLILPHLDTHRKLKYERRALFNAMCYILFTGCQWRNLPKDFPPYNTVFYHYSQWKKLHLFEQVWQHLYILYREDQELPAVPRTVAFDSQSIQSQGRSQHKGYDGHKKKKGHKRHIVCDQQSIPLALAITPANYADGEMLIDVMGEAAEKLDGVKRIYADSAYQGKTECWVKDALEAELIISPKEKVASAKGFKVQKVRWVVEKCFAFMVQARRLVMDYERTFSSVIAWIILRFILILSNRLT